jgi:hypothetical protein
VCRVDEPEHGDDPDVRVLDRQEEPAVGDVGGGPSHRRGEVVGPRAAADVVGAEGGVAAHLLVGLVRVQQEGAGRVHRHHHRPVDALGVAPGVDHRCAGSGALAQQVDLVVAERDARGLEIVDLLHQAVAGEIDAVVGEPVCAGPVAVAVRAEEFVAENVGRTLQRRLDLGTVEADGAGSSISSPALAPSGTATGLSPGANRTYTRLPGLR